VNRLEQAIPVLLALWFVLLALPLSCSSGNLEALTAAEKACRIHVGSVIDSGSCDDHADLADCPAYQRSMVRCRALLEVAAGAE
jgi:hypothetical protein